MKRLCSKCGRPAGSEKVCAACGADVAELYEPGEKKAEEAVPPGEGPGPWAEAGAKLGAILSKGNSFWTGIGYVVGRIVDQAPNDGRRLVSVEPLPPEPGRVNINFGRSEKAKKEEPSVDEKPAPRRRKKRSKKKSETGRKK